MARVIFDSVTIAYGAHHLDIKERALRQALRFHKFSGTLQFFLPPFEFFVDGDNGTLALLGGHDVVRFGIDGYAGQVFLSGAHFTGERIDLTDRVNLLTPHLETISV